jgi:hypothetical protein
MKKPEELPGQAQPTGQEVKRLSLNELYFRPEIGTLPPSPNKEMLIAYETAFLSQLTDFLMEEYLSERLDFVPDELVYCALDQPIEVGINSPLKRTDRIKVTNEVGWKRSVENQVTTPFGEIRRGKKAVIGLFEKNQLSIPSYESKKAKRRQKVTEIYTIVPRKDLIRSYASDPLNDEVVIHKDYPDKSPIDALVGIIYIDD